MRKQIRKVSGLALATALIAVASASPARADERVIARVPFDFVAGETHLPAGEYVLKAVSEDLIVWEVTSVDGRQSAMITTIAASSPGRREEPELVFDKFDNEYFLARVVTVDTDEREIPLTPARMEHEIVKLSLKP
jgi:hypothetical protein